jgi:hypothetical protein
VAASGRAELFADRYGLGSPWTGSVSFSSLTLQPFAAPLVTLPMTYPLPQVAAGSVTPPATAEAPAGPSGLVTDAAGVSSDQLPPWAMAAATAVAMLASAVQLARVVAHRLNAA